MITRVFLAVVLSLSFAFAGQGSGEKPKIKKTNVSGVDQNSPVSKTEAAAVFARARKAIASARIAAVTPKSGIAIGNGPVTREEVILEMNRILQGSRKSIKFVPMLTSYDAKRFKVASSSARSALTRLVAWGFVAPVGPLAGGPKPGLTVAQFGDAVGFFMARLADVTHMPSPKWSPYLQPNDGGK
jgi:hypothetical protein